MKYLLSGLFFTALILLGFAFSSNDNARQAETDLASFSYVVQDTLPEKVIKTEEEWRQILSSEEYKILREDGTEPPFNNEYFDHKEPGIYVCAACGTPLYSSEHKYKSGTGWPSFWKPLSKNNITEKEDRSFGMIRIEIECAVCGGHLGHVFDDGPKPTGLRYCMNSAAMDFIHKDDLDKKE